MAILHGLRDTKMEKSIVIKSLQHLELRVKGFL